MQVKQRKMYFLDVKEGIINEKDLFNASTKAKTDTCITLERLKIKKIILQKNTTQYKAINIVLDFIRVILLLFKILFCVPSGSYLLIQRRFSYIKLSLIARMLNLRNSKLFILIHDVNSLRFTTTKGTHKEKSEIKKYNKASDIIVHTPAMGEKLRNLGIISKQHILYLFDYYTDNTEKKEDSLDYKYEIIFAGNLEKTEFLKTLNQCHFEKLMFNLYGYKMSSLIDNKNIRYFGKFQANHVSEIQGGWGLVWDGDSINTCNGILGEYLKYNSSHKCSLYLVAEVPLIIWSQSSLKEFVIAKNIGIAVDSINEIENIVANISDAEYNKIRENVRALANDLRNGKMLEKVITEIISQ